MVDVSVLEVQLYGVSIGTLTHLPGDRSLFAFNEDYVANENRPVLSLKFKDELGELITDFKPVQTRVMPFFSNLLPEGSMRDYLAKRAEVKSAREFFLLWVLGMDLPGAVTLVPPDEEAWPQIDDEQDHHTGKETRENVLRFSLAGVQLKFSAVAKASGGLTIPAKGVGGSWIVKLPSTHFQGVPENEFSMMALAGQIGIDVPEINLIDIDEIENLPEEMSVVKGQALAIKRFDRLDDGQAVHIEDFAQVFGVYPADKYEKASARNIAQVISGEGGDADVVEFIKRLTFNTLIGNADMHLKNWSLIYADRQNAALAPAYDFVSTIPYIPDETAALNFSRTKRFDEFSQDELLHLASRARLPGKLVLDTAQETVSLFHERWLAEKNNLPMRPEVVDAIEGHLKKIPIAKS